MGRNILWILVFILGPLLLLFLIPFVLSGEKKRQKEAKHRSVRSLTAVTLLLSAAMLLYWGLNMAALTWVTAEEIYHRCRSFSEGFADWAAKACSLPAFYDPALAEQGRLWRQYEHPGDLAFEIQSGLHSLPEFTLPSRYSTSILTENSITPETAVLFLDGEGKLLYGGRDVVFFPFYAPEEAWTTNAANPQEMSGGWVDLGREGEGDPFARLREIYRRDGTLRFEVETLRISGYLEGTEIRPAAMAMLTQEAFSRGAQRWQEEKGEGFRDAYFVDDLDRAGYLEWEQLFGDAGAEAGVELTTIYASFPEMNVPGKQRITLRGAQGEALTFENLDALLMTNAVSGLSLGDHENLRTVLRLDTRYYFDLRDPAEKKLDFLMLTAVCFHPLKSAMRALRLVYIAGGLLSALLVLLLRNSLKKRLITPITDVADGMAGDWYNLYTPWGIPSVWREPAALIDGYWAEQDRRRSDKNEIKRLQKALDYAREAEQARRLFTSNLAHELKTPLAVVHSYAEGLLSHIAEEKREQYLDTILSEAERMDGLVMEMLDLSRLEAGKVRLSRDGFDLRALTENVLDKLRPLAEERGLAVTLTPGEPCPVTADEGRIAQVLENLLSNALRYAPAGTWAMARVGIDRGKACFRVENPVERSFTVEELSRVWEPFYRRDKARSGRGTGLGLSIVKNVVELHGGKCQVWNTGNGVEFSVELPL